MKMNNFKISLGPVVIRKWAGLENPPGKREPARAAAESSGMEESFHSLPTRFHALCQ